MSVVKIRIYRQNIRSANNEKKLIKTSFVTLNSEKKLTAKKAGQILANNFSDFDRLNARNGLQKSEEGFLAMRPVENEIHIWEYAIITEEEKE
ncbi:MAG: hypothetical protein K1X72_12230 [Pyrinomonadaceae bacterium]|nr:hypothetical protein [Pyrinomonadaceae bacterium]